jgi:hypothetical protein
MAKSVEERLMQMLAAGRNGTPEKEGAKELKLLKDRNVSTEGRWKWPVACTSWCISTAIAGRWPVTRMCDRAARVVESADVACAALIRRVGADDASGPNSPNTDVDHVTTALLAFGKSGSPFHLRLLSLHRLTFFAAPHVGCLELVSSIEEKDQRRPGLYGTIPSSAFVSRILAWAGVEDTGVRGVARGGVETHGEDGASGVFDVELMENRSGGT